jgi:hypothetical protein
VAEHQFAGWGTTVSSILKGWVTQQKCSGLWIAAAYATVSGVREILDTLGVDQPVQMKFIIGLDDYITQPGALELLKSIPGSKLRVASLSGKGSRFHPKAYYLKSERGSEYDLSVVGSSNLSHAALNTNCEINSCAIGDSDRSAQFFELWDGVWRVGEEISDDTLEKYARIYAKARRFRSAINHLTGQDQPDPKRKVALKSDETQVDPGMANTCWIEGGYITLMGRELEFKAEQALFFGLPPQGADNKYFQFVTSAGNVVQLRMKYQGNLMWRLQLNDEVPEVRKGLRPRLEDGTLGRSPFVAVFSRTNAADRYDLQFVELDSKAFRRLRRQSELEGAIGRTSAREYGWF